MAVTSYTALPNNAVQAGGRPRGTTVTALRDNPLAIAESDPTAPVNQTGWHPYNRQPTNGNTQLGRFYNFGTDGAVTNFVTPDFEDNYEYLILIDDLSCTAAFDLQIECFRDTDAAYNPVVTLINSGGSGNSIWGILECPFVQRNENHHFLTFRGFGGLAGTNNVGTVTPVTVRNTMVTAQKIRRIRFSSASATDSGSAFMYRRRLII